MTLAFVNNANYVDVSNSRQWKINANLSCELLKQGHRLILSQNQQAVLPKRLSLLIKCHLVGGMKKYKTS